MDNADTNDTYDGGLVENLSALVKSVDGKALPQKEDSFTDSARLISDLTYVSYATNRDLSPDVEPERWAKIYGSQTRAMEERYQQTRKPSGSVPLESKEKKA